MTQSSYKFFFILLFISTSAFCQFDSLKWQKAEFSYEKSNKFIPRNYSFKSDNAGELVTKSFTNAYWFFISDVDGENCPFRPSCSVFFLESIKETNIFQASLMFFDRFTRDMNPAKGHYQYPRVRNGYFYDPSTNYTLSEDKIIYIPPAFIVDD
ncbi:MAG: membrane protein insertion efficiency factor YidD [Ignavibacteriaceae bacterium]